MKYKQCEDCKCHTCAEAECKAYECDLCEKLNFRDEHPIGYPNVDCASHVEGGATDNA